MTIKRELDGRIDEAALAMEACDEYHKTGLTPKELANHRDSLMRALREIEFLCDGREDIDNNGGPNIEMQIMQTIARIAP